MPITITALYRYDSYYRCTIEIPREYLAGHLEKTGCYYLYVRGMDIALFAFECDIQLEHGLWEELWATTVEDLLYRCVTYAPFPSQADKFRFTPEGAEALTEFVDATRIGIIEGEAEIAADATI